MNLMHQSSIMMRRKHFLRHSGNCSTHIWHLHFQICKSHIYFKNKAISILFQKDILTDINLPFPENLQQNGIYGIYHFLLNTVGFYILVWSFIICTKILKTRHKFKILYVFILYINTFKRKSGNILISYECKMDKMKK